MTPTNELVVVDFFSGTGSATRAFDDRGHRVVSVELDTRFPATLHADMLDVDPDTIRRLVNHAPIDFLWASPPCTSYSVGSFRHHWQASTTCQTCGSYMQRAKGERWYHDYDPDCTKVKAGPLEYEPKSDTGRLGEALLLHTLELIELLAPTYWVLENPRALMRKMPALQDVERRTITHCQYGDPRRMKPTDLFGEFPPDFEARHCKNGADCHEAAPRGAKTGTQGLSKTESAMLPPKLGLELCLATEQATFDRLAA